MHGQTICPWYPNQQVFEANCSQEGTGAATKLTAVFFCGVAIWAGVGYALPTGHEMPRDVSRPLATRPAVRRPTSTRPTRSTNPGIRAAGIPASTTQPGIRRPGRPVGPTSRPGIRATGKSVAAPGTGPATAPVEPVTLEMEKERRNWLERIVQGTKDLEQNYGTRVTFQMSYQQQTVLHGEKPRRFRNSSRSESGSSRGALSYAIGIEQGLWKDASLVVTFGGGAGRGLERVLPTFSGLNDDIEPDDIFIGNVFLKQNFLDNKVYTAGGLLQLSDWFDTNAVANDAAEQFSSSSLVNDPTIPFSYASPGVVAGVRPNDLFYAQTALAYNQNIDAFVPVHYSYLKEDYLLNMYELGLTPKINDRKGNYRLLFWLDQRYGPLLPGTSRQRNQRGAALSFDQQVTDRISVFARYGLASTGALPVADFWSLGAQLSAPFPGRKEDAFGVAMGQSLLDAAHERAWRNRAPAETVYEMYYRIQLTDYLSITPNLQFVTHPEGNRNSDYATIAGIRLVLSP
jgi:hypothetical protein